MRLSELLSSPPNPEVPESRESKRTCVGRTLTLKRCRLAPGPNKLLCPKHRHQRITFPIFLIGFAASLVGLYQGVKPLFVKDAALQKLARMDEERAKLQGELDKQKERTRQLAGGVGVAARWADSLAQSNPAIAALAGSLEALIEEFEAEVDLEKLSDVDDLRYRLSKATLANAQQRYADVQVLVPVEEAVAEFQAAKKQIERAETQTNRAIVVNQVLGDGFYGLREWRKALECYERIVDLRPDRWATRHGVANCLLKLGQLSDASIHFGEIVAHFTVLVEQEGRTLMANDLAHSLNNRGVNFRKQGKIDDAIKDFDKAIKIWARVVEQEGRTELANDLAMSLNNRGVALETQGKLDDAIEDYDKAIEILTRLVEQDGRTELANDLALSLNNRGVTFRSQGKLDDAMKDYDKAIEILTRLVEQEGRIELRDDLVNPLALRGLALRQQGKSKKAIDDITKAVGILEQLVSEGRSGLEGKLQHTRRILADLKNQEPGE